MRAHLIAYGASAVSFALIDFIWLSSTAAIYRRELGDMLLGGFRPVPAALFYFIYIAGIVIFAVSPALRAESWKTALVLGGLLGFVAYATYDLTNQATLAQWSTQITLMDLAWGTFLTSFSAVTGYLVTMALTK
jgi:uncharacterized membrane protein